MCVECTCVYLRQSGENDKKNTKCNTKEKKMREKIIEWRKERKTDKTTEYNVLLQNTRVSIYTKTSESVMCFVIASKYVHIKE